MVERPFVADNDHAVTVELSRPFATPLHVSSHSLAVLEFNSSEIRHAVEPYDFGNFLAVWPLAFFHETRQCSHSYHVAITTRAAADHATVFV